MDHNEKLDIVVITFSGEMGLLKLQARSIARHFDPSSFGIIHIFVNEVHTQQFIEVFNAYVLPDYGIFRDKVRVYNLMSVFETLPEEPGWRTQQSLKLLAHRYVETENFVVLDTKNHAIRRISRDDFISHDGRMISHRASSKGSLQKFFLPSLAAFGINDSQSYIDSSMPSTTPFVMDRSFLKTMLQSLEGRHGVDFLKFFHVKARPTTEFFLYYAFLLSNNLVDRAYVFRQSTAVTLFASWPETAEKFEWAINKARQPSTKFFGLHRKRGPELDAEQRKAVEAIWQEAGLLPRLSEFETIIRNQVMSNV